MKRVYSCLCLGVLLFSGCWILPFSQVVTIRIPDIPPGWPADSLLFSLAYPDAGGELKWRRDLSPGDEVVYLLPREPPVPVAAYPNPVGWRAPVPGLKCAGGVYPQDGGRSDPLILAWEDGFLVEILQRLTPEERAPLNIEKIREEIALVAPENPWLVDGESLLDSLLYHRFTSATVKLLPSYLWPIPGGMENYLWGNPFTDSASSRENPASVLLPGGIHFFSSPDGAEQIRLEIAREGWRSLSLQSGEVLSGQWESMDSNLKNP